MASPHPWTASGDAAPRHLQRIAGPEPGGLSRFTVAPGTHVTGGYWSLVGYDRDSVTVYDPDGTLRWWLDLSGLPGDVETLVRPDTQPVSGLPPRLLIVRRPVVMHFLLDDGRRDSALYDDSRWPAGEPGEQTSVAAGYRQYLIVGADVQLADQPADGDAAEQAAPVTRTVTAPCGPDGGTPVGLESLGEGVLIHCSVPGVVATVADP